MDKKLYEDRMNKFDIACKQLEAVPEIVLARGKQGNREVLLFLCGPTLTLQSVEKLREEIKEILDAKEKQLKGESDPGTAVIYH